MFSKIDCFTNYSGGLAEPMIAVCIHSIDRIEKSICYF